MPCKILGSLPILRSLWKILVRRTSVLPRLPHSALHNDSRPGLCRSW